MWARVRDVDFEIHPLALTVVVMLYTRVTNPGALRLRNTGISQVLRKNSNSRTRKAHWADPLKACGDARVKQGNMKDALAKYDEALKYAPNWKQLKEAREAAVQQKG